MTSSSRFVGREQELGQLGDILERALAGQGQICMVLGEAGSGKTALVNEFARCSQVQHRDLVVAVGQSDAQTGAGDAFLPFREVLCQLTGDVEAKLARGDISEENAGRLRGLLSLSGQALAELGPDLVGIFVPGAGLMMRASAFVAEKAGWLDKLEHLSKRPRKTEVIDGRRIEQGQIFEQYTNVLRELASRRPILLVLDDLQWADQGSIDLLFRLGRRIENSRVMIVGTYRPDEVALGREGQRHPLEKVTSELKRYLGEIEVDLNRAQVLTGRAFVDDFLDTELNDLGEDFRQALFRHTGGHPLFTIELLRNMQERGDLVRDSRGRWIENSVLDWETLPARVEGVIEERIGRLEAELRAVLTAASVEGEDFTAEVVARTEGLLEGDLVRQLSRELERRHRLVAARGIRRIKGKRLSLYRFEHNLFHKYLYGELDEASRAYLHEEVGLVLEELFGEQVDEIAIHLAHHFSRAGLPGKARTYLLLSGEQAAARFANVEALDYLDRALALTKESEEKERFEILDAREQAYNVLGRRGEQEKDLNAMSQLAEALDDDQYRAEVLLRKSYLTGVCSDYSVSIELAKDTIALARTAGLADIESAANLLWASSLFRIGDYHEARKRLQQALSLAREVGLPRREARSLDLLGVVECFSGELEKAREHCEQALEILRSIGDRLNETGALMNLGIIHGRASDYPSERQCFEEAVHQFRELGHRQGESMALLNLGFAASNGKDYSAALDYSRKALAASLEIGRRQGEAGAQLSMGIAFFKLGDFEQAHCYISRALGVLEQLGDQASIANALGQLGLITHYLGDSVVAEALCRRALALAEKIGDRNSEADALANLGHVLFSLDRPDEARESYQGALRIRHEAGQIAAGLEAQAGLARIALLEGDLDGAVAQAEDILHFVEANSTQAIHQDSWILMGCYWVLEAVGHSRAPEVLSMAFHSVQETAGRIENPELNRSFLENIPVHREIREQYARTQADAHSFRKPGS